MYKTTLILLTVLLAQCSRDETVAAYGGAERVWALSEMDGRAWHTPTTLTFPKPGEIAGQAPCNRYSAPMTAPYPWFETGPILSTKIACPDLQSERRFFEALSGMSQSEISGSTLVLRNDAGQELVFTTDD